MEYKNEFDVIELINHKLSDMEANIMLKNISGNHDENLEIEYSCINKLYQELCIYFGYDKYLDYIINDDNFKNKLINVMYETLNHSK